ncbi:pesticin C-terminus-like muramidase [Serratia rubidaea]|uniref:pesticin C-terminus-like muramidase n=1 Tax=Serratia rubidaea TaxID=61652 RepID=UPI0006C76AB9|nr:pesticin C-terminus-like muramidase [Serratia rubidaea]QPR62419.1 hypothetical protein I6G83_16540 [Serratia rubidaea]HAY0635810.1 hypothetical protein [Serratia rubidaea]
MVADTASIGVNRGLLTFNAEGNNIRESLFYSRVIHFPRMGISGVTIGRGYDIGSRSQQEVFVDLTRAGIAPAQAQAISLGVGLRGKQADDFVKRNSSKLIYLIRLILFMNDVLKRFITPRRYTLKAARRGRIFTPLFVTFWLMWYIKGTKV